LIKRGWLFKGGIKEVSITVPSIAAKKTPHNEKDRKRQ
jgi:hypothetical protein